MHKYSYFLAISFLIILNSCNPKNTSKEVVKGQPNILWIIAEDLAPYMGCYGDKINENATLNIDKLAENGILFTRAYATAPVCSASRSALITGVNQLITETHNHRSSRFTKGQIVPDSLKIHLPEHIETLPELMKKAGYNTFNKGKDDYNFDYNRRALYDVGTKENYIAGMNSWQGNFAENFLDINTPGIWSSFNDDKPWFGQIQIQGGKTKRKPKHSVSPDSVTLPIYYPNTETFRNNLASHYDANRVADSDIQKIIQKLKDDGEYENTIIFFFSDHGSNVMLRDKQYCYEEGLHVPLIISGDLPKSLKGQNRNDLVSLLDVTATTIALATGKIPNYYDGIHLLSDQNEPRKYLYGARDRCDFTIDKIRSVATKKYRYIRNYYPDRPLLQSSYRDVWKNVQELRTLKKEDQLTNFQDSIWFGIRPTEELYNLEIDPKQIHNLIEDVSYKNIADELRNELNQWLDNPQNKGNTPENTKQLKATYEFWKNRKQFKNVNPEYEQFYN